MGRLRLHERWRKQAQRFLETRIRMCVEFARLKEFDGSSTSILETSFCPDAARKACLDVLAADKAREAERAVFTDWAVSRGWAPGKAPAASEAPELLTCPICWPPKRPPIPAMAPRVGDGFAGMFNPFADIGAQHEAARMQRQLTEQVVRAVNSSGGVRAYYAGRVVFGKCPCCSGGRGGWPGKLPALWQLRGGRRDAATPTAVKTAQRILDTLDGRCPWAPNARGGLAYLPAVELRKKPTVPSVAGHAHG